MKSFLFLSKLIAMNKQLEKQSFVEFENLKKKNS